MTATILRGDARNLPLADESVDLVCTSPPYWALRSYQDQGKHYDGQIGAESTPGEYIDALIECTREWMRVLKPSGSLWLNLGDKYSTGSGGKSNLTALGERLGTGGGQKQDTAHKRSGPVQGVQSKSLLGLPWRYALRCIDELGLILRAEVIWAKPSGLPESVRDRVRRSHEQWFHMVKEPQYFSAIDEVREPHAPASLARYAQGDPIKGVRARRNEVSVSGGGAALGPANPLGKLPGSVWTIAAQPFKAPPELGIEHYAAFPPRLVKRIIQGWSPSGICTECGEGRRPVVARGVATERRGNPNYFGNGSGMQERWSEGVSTLGQVRPTSITGYACACPEPTAATRPSVVLDPFGGTGTTALVASVLGRHGISVDASADYCRLAAWRTQDPGERARVIGAPKPKPEAEGQTALFDMEDAA